MAAINRSPKSNVQPRSGDVAAPGSERARLIMLLHVAKRDLSMADEDYRTVLRTASKGQHDSSSDMSLTELERALSHMKRCGFRVRRAGKSAKAPKSRPMATEPMDKKIRAVWLMLHDLGAVQNPSEEALAAYVKRMTKVDALQWLDGAQAERVIESLKKWALRYLPDAIKRLVDEVKDTRRLGYMEAMQLNAAISHAFSRGTFDPMVAAWEALNRAMKEQQK